MANFVCNRQLAVSQELLNLIGSYACRCGNIGQLFYSFRGQEPQYNVQNSVSSKVIGSALESSFKDFWICFNINLLSENPVYFSLPGSLIEKQSHSVEICSCNQAVRISVCITLCIGVLPYWAYISQVSSAEINLLIKDLYLHCVFHERSSQIRVLCKWACDFHVIRSYLAVMWHVGCKLCGTWVRRW